MIELTVVTPQGEAYSGPVETVVLPGAEGEFGVLERHERYLAPLKPGPARIQLTDGSERFAAMSGGFADVDADSVVVMVDRCEAAEDIDAAEHEAARDAAQAELVSLPEGDEHARQREALEEQIGVAEAFLNVARR